MPSINPVYSDSPYAKKETHSHWLMARLSWGAIFAGCLVALSVHLLLTMLGIGLGFRLVNPYTDENPALGFTTAAGLAWTISALISLWVGGWVAGRTSGKGYGNVGGLHGIVVWSVATVLSFTIFSGAVGLLAGGAAVALGKAASSASAEINGTAANNNGATAEIAPLSLRDTVAGFLDEYAPANGADTIHARREIGEALYRYFTLRSATSHAALVQALVDNLGKSHDAADAIVQEWEKSYDQIKVDQGLAKARAEQAAVDATARLSKALTDVATWTFLMFGVGAFAAAWGGRCGGQRALKLHTLHASFNDPVI